MTTIISFLLENYQKIIIIGVIIILFSMAGNLTESLRGAKKGLKEAATPMGFIIIIILFILAYQVYKSIKGYL